MYLIPKMFKIIILLIIISATLGHSTKVLILKIVTTTPKNTCMHLEAPNVCVWYIVVVLGSVVTVLGLHTLLGTK
jgi:hypothetical protein